MDASTFSVHKHTRCLQKRTFPIITALLFLLPGSAVADDSWHDFGMNGKAVLCVHSSDLDPALIRFNSESTDLAVGSGQTPGFAFLFGEEKLRELTGGLFRVLPEFEGHPYVNKLSGSIGFLSVPDSRRFGPAMRARDLESEWYAKDRCAEELITELPGSGLFEVKCNAKDKYSNVLNVRPDRGKAMPEPNEIVAATCINENISVGQFSGASRQSCRRVKIIDGFLVDYQVQEDNVPLYQQFDGFLEGKIAEWKKNCRQRPLRGAMPARLTTLTQ